MTLERLRARLERDRYNVEDARDELDAERRRGWNAAIDHALAILAEGDVEAGLRELRDATPRVMSGVVEIDLSDIEGEAEAS